MTQPFAEVDTSLSGNSQKTGMPGIDAAVSDTLETSMLPVATQGQFAAAHSSSDGAPNFSGLMAAGTGTRADAVNFAKQFLGVPYVWGGTTPNGFDCSGFTQYIAKRFGISLPRLSQQQANVGSHVDIKDLAPGDLVLFPGDTNNGMSGPGHVALYIGGGQIIEAPHTGATVRIRSLGKENVYGVHLNYKNG